MKTTLIIFTTILFQSIAIAQSETIECQGETIVVVDGEDTRTTANDQNASTFVINMMDSTLTVKSWTRTNGLSEDVFLILKKSLIAGKEVYDLANPSQLDQSTYGLSVNQKTVELVMFVNGRTIAITSNIKRRYEQVVSSEKFNPLMEATFEQNGDITRITWSVQIPDSITIITDEKEQVVEVIYVDKGLNEVVIYLLNYELEYIAIDDFGNSNLGKFVQQPNGMTVENVCDELMSALRKPE